MTLVQTTTSLLSRVSMSALMNNKTNAQMSAQVEFADIVKAGHEAVMDGLKKIISEDKVDVSFMVFGSREPYKDMSDVSKLLDDNICSIINCPCRNFVAY